MKRNLFAIFLAVMLVAVLVFFVTPDAKATSGLITAQENGETITVSDENTVLNLNGKKNVVVKIENNVTLSVIDTSFMVDEETLDLTGDNAGTLTVDAGSTGTIAPVAFDGNFRYLADVTNGTYSFHPFNLAISKLGINTIGEAVCIRVTFIANDVVKAKLAAEGNDYGLKSVSDASVTYSAKENYAFGSKNGVQAFFDLTGSFDADKLDVTCKYQAYMTINGVNVLSNYVAEITPREVLKTLNTSGLTPTDTQKAAIETLAANNAHLTDLFTSVTGASCTHSAMADATCVKPSTCKNCDVHTVGNVDLICGHNDFSGDHFCDDCGGIEGVNIGGGHSTWAPLPGNSATWEISGTMVRPLGDIDGWNFGFAITSGDKKLTFSCVTDGIVFEDSEGHGRYPWHGMSGITRYNLNTDAARLFSVKNNTKDTMYFRAMIVDDVFYAWFGFSEDTLTLTWYVPLAETLTGIGWGDNAEWTNRPFTGFAPGSEYGVEMHVNSTTGSGSILDLDIKTDADVDTTKVPKFVTTSTSNVTNVDNMAGTFTSVPAKLGTVALAGAGKTWEISGVIDRNDPNDQLSLGFDIQSGSKSLKVSAVTRGPLFEANSPSHGYTGSHAIAEYGTTTEYNLNPDIGYFLEKRTESRMYYKAMIANDVFYVWFGFSEDTLELSWVIPLTEELAAAPGYSFDDPGAFTGFEAGSSYQVSLFVRATASTTTYGTFSNLSVKVGGEAPKYVATSTSGVDIAEDNTINSIANTNGTITFANNSATWELSGIVNRYTDSDAWTFGFNIQSGGKSLKMTAATRGCMFENNGSNHSYYGWHAIVASQYNFNTDVEQFLNNSTFSTVKYTEKNKMHFKAMIVDDVFYVWFWFDGQEPVLSWKVPLAETLTLAGSNGIWETPFGGFEAGSSYTVGMYVKSTSATGGIADLSVITGSGVDTSILPADEA